jgi:hypothetical protein
MASNAALNIDGLPVSRSVYEEAYRLSNLDLENAIRGNFDSNRAIVRRRRKGEVCNKYQCIFKMLIIEVHSALL